MDGLKAVWNGAPQLLLVLELTQLIPVVWDGFVYPLSSLTEYHPLLLPPPQRKNVNRENWWQYFQKREEKKWSRSKAQFLEEFGLQITARLVGEKTIYLSALLGNRKCSTSFSLCQHHWTRINRINLVTKYLYDGKCAELTVVYICETNEAIIKTCKRKGVASFR